MLAQMELCIDPREVKSRTYVREPASAKATAAGCVLQRVYFSYYWARRAEYQMRVYCRQIHKSSSP